MTECANRKPTSGELIATLKAERDQAIAEISRIGRELGTCQAQRNELLAAAKVFRSSLYFDRNTEQVKRITMAAIANAEKPK